MLSWILGAFEGLTALEATAVVVVVSTVAAVGTEFVLLRLAYRYVSTTETQYDNTLTPALRLPPAVPAALLGPFGLTPLPAVPAPAAV